MTKDLALLVGPDQKWLSTTGFLDKVDDNLQSRDGEDRISREPHREFEARAVRAIRDDHIVGLYDRARRHVGHIRLARHK